MADSQYVIDVTAENFRAVVIEGSAVGPVVLDFWAPWCAPCRQLGPALEARAGEGKFTLAKVNVDDNPELAEQFQVSGIPAVYAIKDGKVIDHFAGMLAEAELDDFVANLNPSPEEVELLAAVQVAIADPEAGKVALREVVAKTPTAEAARVALASLLIELAESPEESATLLHGIESGEFAEEAQRLRGVLKLREVPHADADLVEALDDHETAERYLKVGAILAAQGEYEQALETLITGADLDKVLAGGAIREAMLAIFAVIGVRSEMADEYRDKLRAKLY